MTDITSASGPAASPATDPASGPATGHPKGVKPKIFYRKVKNYSRYERFWHWSQAILIFLLAFSGFTVHGTIRFIPFKAAVMMHDIAAFVLIFLWALHRFLDLYHGTMASLCAYQCRAIGSHHALSRWHDARTAPPLQANP